MSSSKIDPNSSSTSFVENLVRQGGFGEGAAAAEDGADSKKAGKLKHGDGNAAKITASQSKGASGPALDSVGASAGAGKGAPAAQDGGSLSIGAEAAPIATTDDHNTEVTNFAAEVTPSTNSSAEALPVAPLSLDKDPKVAAAQTQLARDMNDPKATPAKLNDDVKKLVKALKDAGRSDDSLQIIADAMPANTSARNMSSVFAMAAKNGVDLDNSSSKLKDARSSASLNKTDRAQQAAAQKAAQMAASGAAQSFDPSAQRKASGGGMNGPSNWDGKQVSATTATSDTSSVGGSGKAYSGPASNFPNDTSKWASWDDLWSKASAQMQGPNTSEQAGWIQKGIEAEAAKTGIDKRFILAVVMQESGGNVNVGSTNNGVNNPGIMQSHNGASFDGSEASVMQMIKDGVEGTASGDGLVQGLQQKGDLFSAARMYNSGQVNDSNLSDAMGATGSYASDLANRVMGRM